MVQYRSARRQSGARDSDDGGAKVFFFEYLIEAGFKTIEVGFPASSPTEFRFTRKIIEQDMIPDDVKIQVVTQSRRDLIDRTFEAVAGCQDAVIHLYSSISDLHREVVFKMTHDEVIDLAVRGARRIAEMVHADIHGTAFTLQFTPENFSQADPDFAVKVCDAVVETWLEDGCTDIIINLPATVESSMPHIYADQVEYFCRRTAYRDQITVSVHTHNDRGTGVAATELGLLAGADRVEGTLFGNGERTGNADIMTVALNLLARGIDPELDFSDMNRAVEVYELSTGMEVHPRHPYAGDMVYTAFAGSHQDAIRKVLAKKLEDDIWNVPYLPIDPRDVGRSFEPVIRINSQSGKGGVSYIMEEKYGYQMPKVFQRALSSIVTEYTDYAKNRLQPEQIYALYEKTYQNLTSPFKILNWDEHMVSDTQVCAEAVLWESPLNTDTRFVSVSKDGIVQSNGVAGRTVRLQDQGRGLIDAISHALGKYLGRELNISLYQQHALEQTTSAKVVTYIGLTSGNTVAYGTGMSGNFTKSSLRALMSAVNRLLIDESTESDN